MTGRKLLAVAALLLFTLPLSASRRRSVRHPEPPRDLTAVEWLRANAIPFATTEARSGTADLEPLRTIVGDARIVSLGEATHGSREFFTMKHRVLEYLVEEMGFTVFAIEANLPEADVVDDYVMNGNGTAAAALRGMYFWTWDTAEVLDMIEWMREYNLRRGDRPPVRFRGFDAQIPTWTIGTVDRYVTRVDPAAAPTYATRLACMLTEPAKYRELPAKTRDACAASVAQAIAAFTERRADYSARSSAVEYENHLRYLRVIDQSESIRSGRRFRDHLMAENVEWLMDVAHPGEKAVLWAHNVHVSADRSNLMGHPLKARFGDDIVNVAFAFDHGGFNAYGPDGFRAYTAYDYPEGGWETFFREAGRPLFLLDVRNPQQSPAAVKYLAGHRRMWAIGAVWQPMYVNNQRWSMSLSEAYDVIIYIETVTPTVMNPF